MTVGIPPLGSPRPHLVFIMFKVVVAGSRGFSNYELMKERLLHLFSNYQLSEVEIVSGTANGADQLGEDFAAEFGCQIKQFPADWGSINNPDAVVRRRSDGTLYNAKAGYDRNKKMAQYADACVCFWDGHSRGTKDMITLAKDHGIPVKVVRF